MRAVLASLLMVPIGAIASLATVPPPASMPAPPAPESTGPGAGPERVATFLRTERARLATSPQARAELDKLCRQRDCDASELYWYTDWAAAKAAAKASGKPILSLRLLGNLDEELSCANSRFFRVALYPNQAVRQYLQAHYVLHWQSVRPVPKVTVDFGNGRKLERTLTGNSIHYITAPTGEPIEALPGLYGPQAFLRQLQQAKTAVQQYQARPLAERGEFLAQYHRDRLLALQTQWAKDLQLVGAQPPQLQTLEPLASSTTPSATPSAVPNAMPSAIDAGRIALSKAVVESPLVMAARSAANRNQNTLVEITNAALWQALATRHANDAKLDANSRALILRKLGGKTAAIAPTVQAFESSMALDSIRNEYLLHSQLHQWFMTGISTASLEQLNTRVYDQLFLTPDQDPWLGLVGPESFSAIEGDGIRE
jgi:hypothetical protein